MSQEVEDSIVHIKFVWTHKDNTQPIKTLDKPVLSMIKHTRRLRDVFKEVRGDPNINVKMCSTHPLLMPDHIDGITYRYAIKNMDYCDEKIELNTKTWQEDIWDRFGNLLISDADRFKQSRAEPQIILHFKTNDVLYFLWGQNVNPHVLPAELSTRANPPRLLVPRPPPEGSIRAENGSVSEVSSEADH